MKRILGLMDSWGDVPSKFQKKHKSPAIPEMSIKMSNRMLGLEEEIIEASPYSWLIRTNSLRFLLIFCEAFFAIFLGHTLILLEVPRFSQFELVETLKSASLCGEKDLHLRMPTSCRGAAAATRHTAGLPGRARAGSIDDIIQYPNHFILSIMYVYVYIYMLYMFICLMYIIYTHMYINYVNKYIYIWRLF